MMEEYREVDKSHKKMVKALMHNLESIGTGAASIVANGLKLSGEICCLSAVGSAGRRVADCGGNGHRTCRKQL